MSQFGTQYAANLMVDLYLVSAFLIAGFGAGVMLYERFGGASRRFFGLTIIVALWLVPLGMTHGAPTDVVQHLWFRLAYLALPFTVPGLFWMALALSARPARLAARFLWGGAVAFWVLNVATPWLVQGLEGFFVARTLVGWGWLGALYIAFELIGIALTIRHLMVSRRGALSGAEQKEKTLLTAAAVLGALTILDYTLVSDPLRAGFITPLALLGSVALVTLSAVRYRMFAPGESFATDEVLLSMADAVLVCDGAGRIRGSNRAAHRVLGRTENQLMGRHIGEVAGWWEGGEERAWRGWDPDRVSGTEELELRTGPGESIPVSASVEPIRFGHRAVGSVIVARDIRDRLEAERALQASQRRYMSFFWHNPATLYEFDLEGRFVAANPVAETLLGWTAEELKGRPFSEIIDPADLEKALEVLVAVLGGEAREYELAVTRRDGESREIRGVSIPIFDHGEVVGSFGVALDVTDQTRIQRELEVQRRYFADLFEGSPEGIVLVDAESDRVLRVNQEFTRMFGYTAREAVGRNLNDLIVPDNLQWEGTDLNNSARSGGRVKAETVRRRKDGSAVQVSVLARHLQIPGEPEQLYGVYRDIGDRLETERTLREREEELRHAQKLEAVGKLAGGIAHDFNNLLTVINGHARFARESMRPGEPMEQDLLEIEKAGARAAALTQQLLAYSRRQVLHPQILDPNAVVMEVKGMLGRLIGEHIRVETRLTPDEVRVRVDRGQLEQVLVNLVVNARDAMPEGGSLTLETGSLTLPPDDPRVQRWEIEPGDFVRIRVTDTGSGMDPATLAHAFEPFFTTKPQGKGTGLGLATVFGIVKQSGGHVVVSSQVGEGTACEVILPRSTAVAPPAFRELQEDSPDRPRGTVLVVEDEAAVRKLTVRVLERVGCTVLSAENGAHALEVIQGHNGAFDLVITDLVMPGMGGRELARQLRDRYPDLPILFMSGYDDEFGPDPEGVHSFLAKPFTPAELTRRAAEAMRDDSPDSAA